MNTYHRTQQKQICCTNCGEFGHHFRVCSKPVYSYGIIAFKHKDPHWNQADALLKNNDNKGFALDDINVLLIQRRDSIGFIEIIRSKYKNNDINYIKEQVSGTTAAERKALLEKSFDDLWTGLWGSSNLESKQYKQEFDQAKYKFEQLKEGICVDGTQFSLETIIKETPILWTTPEWGFPKGRRNILEKDLECAKREFSEETGLNERQFTIIKNIEPIKESFYGNNNIHYCHIYYLAWIHSNINVEINKNNELMIKEIGDIGWFSFSDAHASIRSTNNDKREILKRSISILQELTFIIDIAPQEIKKEDEPQIRNEQFRTYGSGGAKSESPFKRKSFNFMES